MIIGRRALSFGLAFVALTGFSPLIAKAEDYPSRPIRVIVPYPAGAAGDILARLVGSNISESLRQPVIIDNRPGGAGIAATAAIARADPDGYSLLLAGPNHTTNVGLFKSLPYDPLEDFEPISLLVKDYVLILASSKSGFTSIEDLIEKSKNSPNTINYGSSGVGTAGHLAMEKFQRVAGIELFHIPYNGATPAATNTASGIVSLTATGYSAAKPFIDSGQLKPLLISSPQRSKALPDVPTGLEKNLDWVAAAWFGLMAPAGTPRSIVDRLSAAASEAMQSARVIQRTDATGTARVGSDPEAFRAFLQRELETWPELIRNVGIEVQ